LARHYVWYGAFEKGILWHLENGKVRILIDNWIPRGDMKSTANLTYFYVT
jgi:hypothetical protein